MKTTLVRSAGAVIGTAALVAGMVACSSPGTADSDGTIDTGRVLNLTLANHSWTTEMQEIVSEFTDDTGIRVDANVYDDEQLAQLYNVKLNAASDEIDVMMYRPLQDAQLYAKNKWLQDLTEDVRSDQEWDWNDFWESSRDSLTVNDQVLGVPVASETGVMYYRKDLLAETGMEYPATMDELRTVVEKIQELHPDVFAFAGRGEKSAAVTQFSSFLYSFGGDWEKDGQAAVDSAAAREAYEFYGGLIRDYGPPGATDMNWPQVMGLLQQGLVAFYPEGSANYTAAVDPKNSTVKDEIGVGPIPAGPAGSKPYNITAMALGINSASTNKAAAWEFLKWASSRETVLKLQQANVPGARTSVWDDPNGTAGMAEDLLATIQGNSKIGVGFDRPYVVNVAEARVEVGNPIVVAIQGGDVDAAARAANEGFQRVIDRSSVK